MLIAGLGIPVMVALNGGLGSRLQSPALASSILLLVGLFGSQAYTIDTRRIAGLMIMALGVFLVLGKTKGLAD